MKSSDSVGITFVNLVVGRGILNGVVNVSLGAYEFNPDDKGEKVELAPVIAARLRMDIICAKALRDSLTELLASVESTMPEAAPTAPAASAAKPH